MVSEDRQSKRSLRALRVNGKREREREREREKGKKRWLTRGWGVVSVSALWRTGCGSVILPRPRNWGWRWLQVPLPWAGLPFLPRAELWPTPPTRGSLACSHFLPLPLLSIRPSFITSSSPFPLRRLVAAFASVYFPTFLPVFCPCISYPTFPSSFSSSLLLFYKKYK